MKNFSHASMSFKKERPTVKAAFGNAIIEALQVADHSVFPNLPVPIKELIRHNKELIRDISLGTVPDQVAVTALELTILQWDASFTLTANYINDVSSGYEKIINQSGFKPVKNKLHEKVEPFFISHLSPIQTN